MNEEQLKLAAINLCEIRGLDPYQNVEITPGQKISKLADIYKETVIIANFDKFETLLTARWATLTEEIKQHEEISEAIIRAIAQPWSTKCSS